MASEGAPVASTISMSAAIAAMPSVGPSVAAKVAVSTKAAMPAVAAEAAAMTAGMTVAVALGGGRTRHRNKAGAEREGEQTGGQDRLDARRVLHGLFSWVQRHEPRAVVTSASAQAVEPHLNGRRDRPGASKAGASRTQGRNTPAPRSPSPCLSPA
jgi:hypothetical protein